MKKMLLVLTICLVIMFSSLLTGCINELPDPVDGVYESPNGAGTLIVEDSIRVLKLSGTHYEMGYAHGYLLAEEIIFGLDNFVFFVMHQWGGSYQDMIQNLPYVDWENCYIDELEGILDGIRDRLPAYRRMVHPQIMPKQVDLNDLKIMNIMSDWGCSSFSAWGPATDDDEVLYARNLDYVYGYDEAFKKVQVIISYDDGDNNQWVTGSFCGYIGCITGMNEQGMTLGLQDTNEFPASDESGFIPRTIIMRKLMEESNPSWTPSYVAEYMEQFSGYLGMNLHVTFPVENRSDDEIAGIIEYDGYADHDDGRSTLRSPSDNPFLPIDKGHDQRINFTYVLQATNHYLKRKTSVVSVDDMRWFIIRNGIEVAKQDGNIELEEAEEIMRLVGSDYTIQTVIFKADDLFLRFYLSEPELGGFDSKSVDFYFEELF